MGKKVFKKKNFKVKAQPYVKKEEVDDVKLEEKP